jgi:predicted HTH transcriptional regulator
VAEAIVNAVAHRDYTSNASVQVMLFSDRLEVWNPGHLPASLSPERLTRPHASIPHNPLLAGPLFLAGYIEQAGTGTLDMIALCREAGLKAPGFRQDGGMFVQTLWRPAPAPASPKPVAAQDNMAQNKALDELAAVLGVPATQVTTQVTEQVVRVLTAAAEPASREALQQAVGLQNREHFRQAYVEPLVKCGWLAMTVPDKPTSRLQKYRLTPKGQAWLARSRKA